MTSARSGTLMASYRYYNLTNLTSNQVDIGGVLPGDKPGVPKALTPRPQSRGFWSSASPPTSSTSLTNDFHYSYLRNFWQWKGANAPAQVAGASGAIEPLGESFDDRTFAVQRECTEHPYSYLGRQG